jgi:hypothetical protein
VPRRCETCCGSGVVCEDHPYRPWVGGDATVCCGAAGMACPDCSPPAPAPARAAPLVIKAMVVHVGGPLCGWRSFAPVGPDHRPPARLPYPGGGGLYLRTSSITLDPDGTRTVYEWQPAPTGHRTPSDCTCGQRGCPNAKRPEPP